MTGYLFLAGGEGTLNELKNLIKQKTKRLPASITQPDKRPVFLLKAA